MRVKKHKDDTYSLKRLSKNEARCIFRLIGYTTNKDDIELEVPENTGWHIYDTICRAFNDDHDGRGFNELGFKERADGYFESGDDNDQ